VARFMIRPSRKNKQKFGGHLLVDMSERNKVFNGFGVVEARRLKLKFIQNILARMQIVINALATAFFDEKPYYTRFAIFNDMQSFSRV
jgi:hypothetical protein